MFVSSFSRFLPGWLLFVAWGILILWLSLIPSPPVIETGFLGWDKFQHAFAYGVFTLLAGAGIVCCVKMMGAKK